MEDRIIELEKRAAYQEDLLDTLNQVITKQQNQIDALHILIQRIKENIDYDGSVDNTPPPHY